MLGRVGLVVAAFFLALCACELPPNIARGYAEGRSGNLVVNSRTPAVQSSLFTLSHLAAGFGKKIDQTVIADLLAHSTGSLPVNADIDRTAFPATNLFSQPKVNLFLAVDDVSSDDLALVKPGKGFSRLDVTGNSYPEGALSQLTSVLTGAQPAEHGIVAARWPSASGAAVQAFVSEAGQPRVGNVPSIMAQASAGKAFTLGASLSPVMAAALAAHPALLQAHPFWNNLRVSYNGHAMESSTTLPDTLVPTAKAVRDQLGSPVWLSEEARHMYAPLEQGVRVTAAGESAVFAFDVQEDFDFLAELFLARRLFTALRSETFATAVGDDVPDFLSFGFSTVRALKSTQVRVALSLLSAVIRSLVEEVNAAYDSRAVASIFLIATAPPMPASLLAPLKGQILDEENAAEYLPYVYVREPTPERVAAVCATLREADVEVSCVAPTVYMSPDLDFGLLAADNDSNTTTNSTGYSSETIAKFQTCLWTAVLLGLAVAGAVYFLFTMETGTDTLLYRSASAAQAAPRAQ